MDTTFSERDRRALLEQLRHDAVIAGDFDLSSGASSSVYVDVNQVSLTGEGADRVGRALWTLAHRADPHVDAVGGMTLGADPLVTAMTLAAHAEGHPLEAIIVRKATKDYGTGERLEVPTRLEEGARVVAVDDVVTTGGSVVEAIEQMREAGFQIDEAVCVVDRQAGGTENLASIGVTLHSFVTLEALLESSTPAR